MNNLYHNPTQDLIGTSTKYIRTYDGRWIKEGKFPGDVPNMPLPGYIKSEDFRLPENMRDIPLPGYIKNRDTLSGFPYEPEEHSLQKYLFQK